VKEKFRSDPRYKAVKHEERENAFNEYIAELKSAEREVEQAAKAKVDEQVRNSANELYNALFTDCRFTYTVVCIIRPS
jgi:transcription elongation regulator 1